MNGWQEVRLADVAQFKRSVLQPSDIRPGTKYIGLENIASDGTIVGVRTVDSNELASAKFSFDSEHVLYGKLRPYLVKTVIPGFDGICSTDIVPIRVTARLNKRYLLHFLRLPSTVKWANSQTEGVNLPRISVSVLAECHLPLPPLAEQQRIASILDAADALRAKRRAAIEEVDSLSQAIFIEMFGDPAGRSKGEGVVPLIDLIDSERPISYGILMPGPDQTEGVKYVRVVDMKDGGIELAGIRKTTRAISDSYKRSLLKSDDVLLSIRGHVGRAAIVPPELEDANITQDTARLAAARTIVPLFLREYLRTDFIQQWMERHTKGVAVQGINLGDVKKIPIALPPLPLQQEFARRIAAVEALKAAHRASLAELDALFASLQHRAFRGEL